MAMKMVKVADATLTQIRYFAEISGIDGAKKMSRDDLIGAIGLAGLPTTSIYVDDRKDSRLDFSSPDPSTEEYEGKNERWCCLQIYPEQDSTEKLTPVFIGVNDDFLYAKRGQKIVIRERFYDVLRKCIETRRTQSGGDDVKFRDATVQTNERHPHKFYGYCGLASKPPVGISEDAIVYT